MANNFARTVTGLIVGVYRIGTTVNANPVYTVDIVTLEGDVETYRTSSDVSLAYGLESRYDLRNTVTTYGLTRAGRLNGYTKNA